MKRFRLPAWTKPVAPEDVVVLKRVWEIVSVDPLQELAEKLHRDGWTSDRLYKLSQTGAGEHIASDPIWVKLFNHLRDVERGQHIGAKHGYKDQPRRPA